MIEAVKRYYEKEITEVTAIINNPPAWVNPKEVINNSIQRCLGVAMFIQYSDIPYTDIKDLYEQTAEQLSALE